MSARQGWKAEVRKQIKAEHARVAREQLAKLREAIRHAKAARKRAIQDARERCKVDRLALRAKLQARRAAIMQRLVRISQRQRQAARESCAHGLAAAREKTGVARARAELAAERQYRRELRTIEHGQRQALKEHRAATAREKRGESDDEVRSNIPESYQALWNKVKAGIKATPRMSRTEAFMHYAEEHPDELLTSLEDDTEALVRKLEAQERAARLSLRRGPESSAYVEASPEHWPF